MQSLPIHKTWILCFLVVAVTLTIVTPALADYLGPNRTVTTTTGGICKIVLNECQYVPEKKAYRYKNVEDWLCSNESKPWQQYPNQEPRPCSNNAVGEQYWSREQGTQEVTTTYPPATIDGSLQGCTLQNGWCGATTPQLFLNANEPVEGYSITLIEGILNGQPFACTGTNCSITLNEGDNNFSFWALSSFGDSSFMASTFARWIRSRRMLA